MAQRRRLPRHLLDGGPESRRAVVSRTVGIVGPVATSWLAAVEAAMAPATRTTSRRRLAVSRTRGVTLLPGSVRAEVRQDGYHNQVVEIAIAELDAAAAQRLLDIAAQRGGWLAAMASGELPEDLAEAMLGAGLAPEPAAISGQCSCRSVPGLCVHAGIAAQVVARVLGTQPEMLLVLRGLTQERTAEEVMRRVPGGAAGLGLCDPAAIAWDDLAVAPAAVPPPVPAPQDAGSAPPIHLPPAPPGTGIDVVALEELAADAAERARELLAHGGTAGLALDADADLARRAAGMGAARVNALARRANLDPLELASLADAWRIGGGAAVSALRRRWWTTPRALEAGMAAVTARHGRATARMNRVTSGDGRTELALGRDGLWYRLQRRTRLAPAQLTGPGDADPWALLRATPPANRGVSQLTLFSAAGPDESESVR